MYPNFLITILIFINCGCNSKVTSPNTKKSDGTKVAAEVSKDNPHEKQSGKSETSAKANTEKKSVPTTNIAKSGTTIEDQWASFPTGLEVIHSPRPVRNPEGPNIFGWTYQWTFRTEIRAIDRPLKATRFYILAWDNNEWILDQQQKKYNSGTGDGNIFEEWYGCPGGMIAPGSPAVDETNWSGNYKKVPFKQKWVFIAEDTEGKKYKGEGIVELAID